ncbi:DMT family transporter [Mesobacterium sp. TK19101]|uniref:DMT family transporter n=1 Tax=Mesobacterium hydrothermale TaxID=3111907 RepID=A0ABU6HKM6_9RHOB|nr:DMT family transporter [Mesobacterium sp. TK19101]MEC3863012.1 DMT family transporter [Mesobacterium sp. TK19101]
MEPRVQRPLRGIFWMAVTGLCFVMVTALVKLLHGRVPAAEAAFLRYLLGLVFLIPMWRDLRSANLSGRQIKLFGIRGFVHSLGVILWFFAMTRIPIAEVTAMNYLNPVYVTVLAVFFLGEKLAARRILAIVAALIGAFVILRPGFRELDAGHFAMMGTAMLFAVSYLLAKIFADSVKPAVVVAMLSITVTIGLAPFAVAVWVTPGWWDIFILFCVACFATAGHFTMTLAFAEAPVSVTQPVTFLQLVWSVALGALVFGEGIDIWVILGGTVIVAAVSFISWREAVLRRRITPQIHAPKV